MYGSSTGSYEPGGPGRALPVKAVRWHGRGDLRLDDIAPPPPPGPDEAQLRVLSCGICGTDAEEYREGPIFAQVGQPHPLTGKCAPVVLGHEVCGRVVAVGQGVSQELVGRLVAVDGLISCGRCWACRAHRVNLCESLASIGFSADGGLAGLMNAPARGCLPLPETLGPDAGVLAEPLAVGVRALRRARLAPGERVAVFGGGAVGLLAAQAGLALGAATVVLVEPEAGRRGLARRLGIPEEVEPQMAAGLDADVVLECSGAGTAVSSAFLAARPTGRVVLVGITTGTPPLPVLEVVRGEREVLGSLSHVYDEDFARAVELISDGAVQTVPLVTATADLSDAVGQIASLGGPTKPVKVVIHPTMG